MNCLWLTRKFPRPANSGELIYSDGLIRSFAATGVDLAVIAHDNDECPAGDGSEKSTYVDEDGVAWKLGHPSLGSRLPSLLSRYPADSWRLRAGGPAEALEASLREQLPDVVLIDHAAIGWALSPVLRRRRATPPGKRPLLVYLSHNHEAKIRREIARQSPGSLLKRLALIYDAEKYARLEDNLCREVDLVTAITDAEVEAYRANFPGQRFLCLTPGYEGKAHSRHEITPDTPRRVVMSGSFEWIAKRINLEQFLHRAAAPLSAAGIELQIVGKADEDFSRRMRKLFPKVDFVGRVPEMEPYLLNARMGLIVEEFGGGFKLKTLEYIFHRLPLAGLTHAVEGLPLHSPEDILLENDTESLVKSVVESIDDFERLNRMSRTSLEICESSFRWKDRGTSLERAIRTL